MSEWPTWQKPVKWEPGDEKPRGLVRVNFGASDYWAEDDASEFCWAEKCRYCLPIHPAGLREAARIRKANSRAKCDRLDMPMPRGTAEALNRIAAAAGFDDRRECVAWVVHTLDALLTSDRHVFDAITSVTTKPGDLSKYYGQLGIEVPDELT